MFRIFQRLFKVVQSEAHSTVDKWESPIKLTEQGIRDLKKDLETSFKNLAEVKAIVIRLKKDQAERKQMASDYEKKAMLLLEKGQKGGLESNEADRLASEALVKKEAAFTQATAMSEDLSGQERLVGQLESNVKKLNSQINKWEGELTTLRARAKVVASTKKLNQQLAQVNSEGTVAMLEKMKSKIQEEEILAESYGEIAMRETDIDLEIDKALAGEISLRASDSLAALKTKMGLTSGVSSQDT